MQNDNHRLLIGAAGWQHEAWYGSFYPDDLPEDWRLAYYANEFPLVLVQQGEQGAIEALTELFEDEGSLLRFVYETELEGEEADFVLLEQVSRRLTPIQSACAGIILRLPAEQLDESYLRQLASRLRNRFPCCIDAPAEYLTDLLPVLHELSLGVCWHTDSAGLPSDGFANTVLAVARISTNELDLKELRKMTERCLAVSTDERQVVMLFDAVPPSLELMRSARVITEFL